MLDEYFEMNDHIYGDVMESLSVFKATQLMLSQGQQKKTAEFNQKISTFFNQKSSKFLKISPESVQKPLLTSFLEKNSQVGN